MKGQTYVIIAIILVIIIAIFAVINVDPVVVNYMFWSAESPLILVILFSVLMGGLITGTAGMFRIFHMKKEQTQLRDENEKMKEKLEELGVPLEEILPKKKHGNVKKTDDKA